MLAMSLDYRRLALFKRTRAFGDVRIGPCIIAGLVVERALKIEYSAFEGVLPKPLAKQTADDHKQLVVAKVLEHGQMPRNATLHVPAADAELAIGVAQRIVKKLTAEMALTMLAADVVDDAMPEPAPGQRFRHDIVARSADGRLVSIEIKLITST